jgi:hypothetical protein
VRCALHILALLAAAFTQSTLLADGGAVVVRMSVGESTLVGFVQPVPPVAGEIELSFLLTHAGSADATTPITLTLLRAGVAAKSVRIDGARGSDGLARSTVVSLDEGEWIVEAVVLGDPAMRARYALAVGPAPAHWLRMAPWMLVWVPIAGLIVARERLVAGRRGRGAPRANLSSADAARERS